MSACIHHVVPFGDDLDFSLPKSYVVHNEGCFVQNNHDSRPIGLDIIAHAVRRTSAISPTLDIRRAPYAHAELNCSILCQQCIPHAIITLGRIRGRPVVSRRRRIRDVEARAIRAHVT